MRLEYTNVGGVFTARLLDKMTFADHGLFRKLLDDMRAANTLEHVFDLSHLDLIDSSGLGMIMLAIDEAKKNRWSLTLKSPQGAVRQLLQLSKLDQLLTVA